MNKPIEKPKEMTLDLDARLDVLADLIIDRYLEAKKKGLLHLPKSQPTMDLELPNNYGTPN